MARVREADSVYPVAAQFRDRCFIQGYSLLWPRESAWSVDNLDSFWEAFVGRPDEGDRGFLDKLHDQVADQPEAVHRVLADLLAFYFLSPTNIKAQTKLGALKTVVGWKLQADQPDYSIVARAFETGFCNPGAFYLIHQYAQISFFLAFGRAARQGAFNPLDVADTKRVADSFAKSIKNTIPARNVLLHLLFPDQFERIASDQDKEAIVKAFRELAGDTVDNDDALMRIRESLVQQLSRPELDFYADQDLRSKWDKKPRGGGKSKEPSAPAGLFRERSAVFLLLRSNEDSKYQDEEGKAYRYTTDVSNYKRVVPGARFIIDRRLREGVALLGTGEISQVEQEDEGPPIRMRAGYGDYHRYDPPRLLTPEELAMLRSLPGYNPQYSIRILTREAFQRLVGEVSTPFPPITLEQLAQFVYMDLDELRELESLLREKRHVIFEGPPGSGKTFVAEKLARYFTGNLLDDSDAQRLAIIQFHQSYSYEDFVQGIRPVTKQGRLEYHVMPGIFKELCETARTDPDRPYVIIVDEVNRGNISRIFGELLLLLEYRDKKAILPYAEGHERERFSIPPNIHVLGTMNTTDRSLAQIDYALRRRFYFFRLLPVENGQAPVLKRWLESQSFSLEDQSRVLKIFVKLNTRVQEELGEHFQVGHSYFMQPDIVTPSGLDRVWRHAIVPLLEEYFYNRKNRAALLAEFDYRLFLQN